MKTPSSAPAEPAWLEVVREKVESLRYGVVQIVVHDGRVTLIERTEKTKLDETAPPRIPLPPGAVNFPFRRPVRRRLPRPSITGNTPTGSPEVHSAAHALE